MHGSARTHGSTHTHTHTHTRTHTHTHTHTLYEQQNDSSDDDAESLAGRIEEKKRKKRDKVAVSKKAKFSQLDPTTWKVLFTECVVVMLPRILNLSVTRELSVCFLFIVVCVYACVCIYRLNNSRST